MSVGIPISRRVISKGRGQMIIFSAEVALKLEIFILILRQTK